MMRSGHATVGDYLDLVGALHNDPSDIVLSSALSGIDAIEARIASDADREQLQAWIRKEFSPEYKALGPFTKDEPQDKHQMRALLFGLLGGAKDPVIISEAKGIADKFLADPASVDPEIVPDAMRIAASNGDAALYDRLLAMSATSKDPTIQTQTLFLTAMFKDQALAKRTLDSVADGKVRNQDSWILLAILLQGRDTRELAWKYIQDNWTKVSAQFTTSSGNRVVGATSGFCSAEKRDEVTSFFTTHKVDAAERTLKQVGDSINGCIQLHEAQEPNLKKWLAAQGVAGSASGQ
jgi:aminopeptidase N/puromycin-sensitive aminopeptidase